jgi:hypothetical protein
MLDSLLKELHKELTHSRHIGKVVSYNDKDYVVFYVMDNFLLVIRENESLDPPPVYLLSKKEVRKQKDERKKQKEKDKKKS